MQKLRMRRVLLFPLLLGLFHQTAAAQQCIAPDQPARLSDVDRRAVVFTSKDNGTVLANFPLSKTLDNILMTARGDMGANVSAAEREALLSSLLGTLALNKLENKESGLTFSVTPRAGEGALLAHDLLDPQNAESMVPVGLFNRPDLAPGDLSNCGEYRIVYAKQNPTGDRDNRFLVIFEAALPNPDPNFSVAGCQEVAQFWDGLRTMTDAQAAPLLADFYYKGGKLPSGTQEFQPVVDYRHYGLLGGQVRGNAFVKPGTQPWHLRQWTISLSQPGVPTFVSAPINENPVPAFFGGAMPPVEPKDVYDHLAGGFRNVFVRDTVTQLTSIDRIAAIPFGPPATAQDLLGKMGVDVDDKFYTVESAAGPGHMDDPAELAKGTALIQEIALALNAASYSGSESSNRPVCDNRLARP